MIDWNVVVTTHDGAFDRAEEFLEDLGPVSRTAYYNVLVLRAEDPRELVAELAGRASFVPDLLDAVISRVLPADRTVDFQTAEEFREASAGVVREWLPELAGGSFFVRMERRGFGEKLSSGEEERRLGELICEGLREEGEPGDVDFDDPDAMVAVDTVGPRAGLGLLTREEVEEYPFLDVR